MARLLRVFLSSCALVVFSLRTTLNNRRRMSSHFLAATTGSPAAWLDATHSLSDRSTETFLSDHVGKNMPVERILALGDSEDSANVVHGLLNNLVASCRTAPTRLIQQGAKLLDPSTRRVVGVVIEVDSAAGQDKARSLIGSVEWVVLHCTGSWTMIPVENLIAACMYTGTKLAVCVDDVASLPGVYHALQTGPDAVVLGPDRALWDAYTALRAADTRGTRPAAASSSSSSSASSSTGGIQPWVLEKATITAVKAGMVGDRVCLDLIQMLEEGEGLLVGSSAKSLCLVHAEVFEGEYVPSRPFRVNAGPVHSYVMMADGSTKYLCEVAAGDTVAVVNGNGGLGGGGGDGAEGAEGAEPVPWRAVAVGRCKTESRPMLLVEFHLESVDRAGTIFLQQAETVRFVAPTETVGGGGGRAGAGTGAGQARKPWRPLPVTEAKAGDAICVVLNELGTHVGQRIEAKVDET